MLAGMIIPASSTSNELRRVETMGESSTAVRIAEIANPPLPRQRPENLQHRDVAVQGSPALAVSLEQALYLIRSTLLTLNDANRSGNYTVLHDLAAPGFQAKNNAADLGQIFAELRRRRIDLFAVALMAPQLASQPGLDGNGMLRLAGHFPTQPLQINFDLLYQNVDHNWRLFGISVQTPNVALQANLPATGQK
jgi:hypothetical protein